MAITYNPSNQTTVEILVTTESGEMRCAAVANSSIRPGKGFALMVDVIDATLVAGNRAEIETSVNAFMAEQLAKAAEAGIPVSAP